MGIVVPARQQRAQAASISAQFPNLAGAIARVDHIKAQLAAIRRRTEAEDLATYRGQLVQLAAIILRLENLGPV